MLIDSLITCVIVAIALLVSMPLAKNGGDNEQGVTQAGLVVLNAKLTAINLAKPTQVTIVNQQMDELTVPFNDCDLRFTSRGTASKAGTCFRGSGSLTLRPGEGGIGYPWR